MWHGSSPLLSVTPISPSCKGQPGLEGLKGSSASYEYEVKGSSEKPAKETYISHDIIESSRTSKESRPGDCCTSLEAVSPGVSVLNMDCQQHQPSKQLQTTDLCTTRSHQTRAPCSLWLGNSKLICPVLALHLLKPFQDRKRNETINPFPSCLSACLPFPSFLPSSHFPSSIPS